MSAYLRLEPCYLGNLTIPTQPAAKETALPTLYYGMSRENYGMSPKPHREIGSHKSISRMIALPDLLLDSR